MSRFHFKVSNCKAGQRVLFSIMNFSKQRSLFREGMSPLVRPPTSAQLSADALATVPTESVLKN